MSLPSTMKGFVLTGHGGLDKLVWKEDLPVPQPGPADLVIRVRAAAVNNTDINARVGWYSDTVTGGTEESGSTSSAEEGDDGWMVSAAHFPRIQGADCCGVVVAVGDGVSASRVGERVIVRAVQIDHAHASPLAPLLMGWDYDGSFAEYVKLPAEHVFAVESDWSDVELASIPVVFSTAENMLDKAQVGAERVLVTGASGGVGSAAVQLAKRRGAHVTAMAGADKAEALRSLGADNTIGRDDPLPVGVFDVVVDLVAGPRWPDVIAGLRPGGRYVTSGAIAGAVVPFDIRSFYFNDLTFYGVTFQPESLFPKLIGYIERNEIRPLVAAIFPLNELKRAQEAFVTKKHVGKIGIVV